MKYPPTQVAGVTIIDLEPRRDRRGFSSRSFCGDEFASRGMTFDVTQTNTFFDYTSGASAAVAVDIRPGYQELPLFGAHGFQTTIDDAEASGRPAPSDEQDFHWEDPQFVITWPSPVAVISGRDASWPSRTPSFAPIGRAASCLKH